MGGSFNETVWTAEGSNASLLIVVLSFLSCYIKGKSKLKHPKKSYIIGHWNGIEGILYHQDFEQNQFYIKCKSMPAIFIS